MNRLQKESGLTLLELLIALLVLAILASIAMPAMGVWIDSNRSNATRQQLQAFIAKARSHALNGAQVVTICHLEDNGACSGDFGFPFTQFVDTDRNAVLSGDEAVLRILNVESPDQVNLSWNHGNHLRFWPSGGTGAITGSLSYCHEYDDKYDFRIVISRTGRTRVDYDETRCEPL